MVELPHLSLECDDARVSRRGLSLTKQQTFSCALGAMIDIVLATLSAFLRPTWVSGMLLVPVSMRNRARLIGMPDPTSHTRLTSSPSASGLLDHSALKPKNCLVEFVMGMCPMPTRSITSLRGPLAILLHHALCALLLQLYNQYNLQLHHNHLSIMFLRLYDKHTITHAMVLSNPHVG